MKLFSSKLAFAVGLLLIAITKGDNKSTKGSRSERTGNKSSETTDSDENIYVVIKVKNPNGAQAAKSVAKDVRTQLYDGSGIMGLTVTAEQEKELMSNPNIEYVGIDYEVFPALHHEKMDAKGNLRQLLEEIPWGIKKVLQNDLQFFQNLGNPSQPFKICVADSGYDITHQDLPKGSDVNGRTRYNENWYEDKAYHGTHVAGTIVALGGNNIGVTSIIPNNKGGKFQLVIGKALNNDNSYNSMTDLMDAVNDCIDMGATVVNLSLGCTDCYDSVFDNWFKDIENRGILIVAAAMNEGDSTKSYPASYGSIISVGSMTELETRSDFSQFNDQIEISAPGSGIRSTVPGNTYDFYYGTSMATPHVAAVAGLIWSYFPSCKNYQVRNVLAKTAKDLGTPGCDIYFGYGLIQAKDAYNLLSNNCGGNLGVTTGVGGCSQLINTPTTNPTPTPPISLPPIPNPTSTPPINPPPTPNPTPTPPINPPPTPNPTPTPPINPPPSPTNCAEVTVTITTDDYPEETSFQVLNAIGIVVMSGSGYTGERTEYITNGCLSNGSYRFTIMDSYGDGMCCTHGNGSYELKVNGSVQKSGGQFTNGESTTFSTSPVPPTNAPVPGPSINVYIVIKTDYYPEETSFKIINQNGIEFMSGGGYTAQLTEYAASKNLPSADVYQYTIYDTAGDGICCDYGEGGYNVFVNGVIIKVGGVFTSSETIIFPSSAPVPVPTNPPVPGPSIEVYIIIKTDTYPEETSFKIIDQNGIEFMSGGGYTAQLTEYTASKSLPSANIYQFTIYDTAGDGICCDYGEGGYNVFVNGVIIKVGGVFTSSETTTFPTNSYVTFKDSKKPKFMKLKHVKSKVDNTNDIVKDIKKKGKEYWKNDGKH